jgi:hypothetical protein
MSIYGVLRIGIVVFIDRLCSLSRYSLMPGNLNKDGHFSFWERCRGRGTARKEVSIKGNFQGSRLIE